MKMMKRKSKWRTLRFRKDDPAHNVLAAVSHWVKAHGGTTVVIGGIEIQRWPEEGEFKYKVAVNCVGKAPQKPDQSAKPE
jgi:hypothetical protein